MEGKDRGGGEGSIYLTSKTIPDLFHRPGRFSWEGGTRGFLIRTNGGGAEFSPHRFFFHPFRSTARERGGFTTARSVPWGNIGARVEIRRYENLWRN